MPEKDTFWMQQCLVLGRQARQEGNPPVGALLLKEGLKIGEGREAGKSKNDITCHAEIEAIRDALHQGHADLRGAILYTTHEPCIMCSYVIRHHQIARVVIGLAVPDVGGYSSLFPILSTPAIPKWGPPPKITLGVLQQQCQALSLET
jgi:tRNA(adenine34) deaminase